MSFEIGKSAVALKDFEDERKKYGYNYPVEGSIWTVKDITPHHLDGHVTLHFNECEIGLCSQYFQALTVEAVIQQALQARREGVDIIGLPKKEMNYIHMSLRDEFPDLYGIVDEKYTGQTYVLMNKVVFTQVFSEEDFSTTSEFFIDNEGMEVKQPRTYNKREKENVWYYEEASHFYDAWEVNLRTGNYHGAKVNWPDAQKVWRNDGT